MARQFPRRVKPYPAQSPRVRLGLWVGKVHCRCAWSPKLLDACLASALRSGPFPSNSLGTIGRILRPTALVGLGCAHSAWQSHCMERLADKRPAPANWRRLPYKDEVESQSVIESVRRPSEALWVPTFLTIGWLVDGWPRPWRPGCGQIHTVIVLAKTAQLRTQLRS